MSSEADGSVPTRKSGGRLRSCIIWFGVGLGVGAGVGVPVGLNVEGTLTAPEVAAGAGVSAAIIAATALAEKTYSSVVERRRLAAHDTATAAERRRQLEATDVDRARQAALVSVELRGGGGFGHNDDRPLTGTSVHIVLTNHSNHRITRLALTVEPPLPLKNPHAVPVSLAPGERVQLTLDTEYFELPRQQASDRGVLSAFTPTLMYSIEGVLWRRVGTGVPERADSA